MTDLDIDSQMVDEGKGVLILAFAGWATERDPEISVAELIMMWGMAFTMVMNAYNVGTEHGRAMLNSLAEKEKVK